MNQIGIKKEKKKKARKKEDLIIPFMADKWSAASLSLFSALIFAWLSISNFATFKYPGWNSIELIPIFYSNILELKYIDYHISRTNATVSLQIYPLC